MLDIMGTIDSTTVVEPSQLSVGESDSGAKTFTITRGQRRQVQA